MEDGVVNIPRPRYRCCTAAFIHVHVNSCLMCNAQELELRQQRPCELFELHTGSTRNQFSEKVGSEGWRKKATVDMGPLIGSVKVAGLARLSICSQNPSCIPCKPKPCRSCGFLLVRQPRLLTNHLPSVGQRLCGSVRKKSSWVGGRGMDQLDFRERRSLAQLQNIVLQSADPDSTCLIN